MTAESQIHSCRLLLLHGARPTPAPVQLPLAAMQLASPTVFWKCTAVSVEAAPALLQLAASVLHQPSNVQHMPPAQPPPEEHCPPPLV